jgi:hypothetical protein
VSNYYWHECPRTKQFVHVATSSSGNPTGCAAHDFVIQLFVMAHAGAETRITSEPNEDSLEWDLGNCIELYERMVQEILPQKTKELIVSAIKESSTDFEGQSNEWLKNYVYSGRGLEFYSLHELPKTV